jgi:uncharacterized protein (TIGR03382 family)
MRGVVTGLLLALGATTASGDGIRAVVVRPADELGPPLSKISSESPYIFLNRCVGGCIVTGGQSNDARNLDSSIPPSGQFLVQEFADENGSTGSNADLEWSELVQCMKEVYSPFAVTITDQEPTNETFTEVLVAGSPTDVDQPSDYLGVAIVSANCAPVDDMLAFAFANTHPGSGMDRVYQICWTAAQESAHAFGLDHEYQFTDGESACRDPMTYRTDCLGEKFFRNLEADCGETAVRPCRCSATQNSAAMLYSVFGSGTPITAPPTVTITYPADGSDVGSLVHATAAAQRGVASVALFINGSRYAFQLSDVPYGSDGQPAADYVLDMPASIPKGTLSLVVTAADDLGISTDSTPVTVSNGPPCTKDSDCLANQTCTVPTGECVYPAPTLELGSACSYDQQCTTWECGDFSSGKACTTDCEVDSPTSCPAAFECIDAGGGQGQCAVTTGGCCDATGSPTGSFAIATAVLGLVLRRRRT